jgi:hypothetical protein
MSRHTTLLLASLLLAGVAFGGLTVVITAEPAAGHAGHEDPSMLDQLSEADSDAIFAGLAGRISGAINARLAWLSGDETTSSDACGNLQAEFNSHNTTITDWANARTNATTGLDTLAITCDTSDETATVYLTAEVDTTSGNYTNAQVVDATDREPDAECRLEEDSADNAADELATFVEEFAAPGEDVTESFTQRLAAQYTGDVRCDGVAGVS